MGKIIATISLSLYAFSFSYLLFLPEFPKISTHYSWFIPMRPPIVPVLFFDFCFVSDNDVHNSYGITIVDK